MMIRLFYYDHRRGPVSTENRSRSITVDKYLLHICRWRMRNVLETASLWITTGPSREVGRGVSYPGPCDAWETAVAQKFKVHQNAPNLTKKIQKFSPQSSPARIFPRDQLWLSTGLDNNREWMLSIAGLIRSIVLIVYRKGLLRKC